MSPRRVSLRVVTVAWLFGAVWFTATSSPLLTTYARALGCTGFEFGLINALPFLAALLSLPASIVIDATGQRRAIFPTGLYGQRLLWLLIAVVPLWLFPGTATAEELRLVTPPLVALFLLLYFLQQTGQAVGGPAWVGWMADLVPEPIRGRYFARRRQLGVLPAVVATLLIGWAVDHFTTGITLGPDTPAAERRHVIFWCSMLFIAVSIPGIIDIALFHWVPHTPRRVWDRGRSGLFRSLLVPLRNRRMAANFFANGLLGQFVALYVLERVRMGNLGAQLTLVIVPLSATAVFLPMWGRAVDRLGRKPLLYLSALGSVPLVMAWSLVTGPTWYLGPLVAAGIAVLWVGLEVTNFNYVLETAAGEEETQTASEANGGRADRGGTGYVAVNSAVTSLAAVAGGLTGGLVAAGLREFEFTPVEGLKTFDRYDVLFAASAMVRLAAVMVFLPRMVEPLAHPTLTAARFMIESLYASATELARAPVRLISPGPGRRSRRKP